MKTLGNFYQMNEAKKQRMNGAEALLAILQTFLLCHHSSLALLWAGQELYRETFAVTCSSTFQLFPPTPCIAFSACLTQSLGFCCSDNISPHLSFAWPDLSALFRCYVSLIHASCCTCICTCTDKVNSDIQIDLCKPTLYTQAVTLKKTERRPSVQPFVQHNI